jgi:hypothetical protein
MKDLMWEKSQKAYHARNEMLDATKQKSASDIRRGLYLYLYSNHGCEHPIHNKNKHQCPPNGRIICPPKHHTLKSGKFQGGLHEKVRKDIHGHPWRPDAKQDHVWPETVCWFLAFETNPKANESGITREGYFNREVRGWLADLELDVAPDWFRQGRLEHRFVRRQDQSPPETLSKRAGYKFLEQLLNDHSRW